MNLELDEDQVALRDSIARLAADHAGVTGDEDRSAEFWAALKANGWLSLPLPEAYGGVGGSLSACGLVLEQAGRQGLVTPFASSAVVGARLLARVGQKTACAALAAGELQVVLAHAEGGEFDPEPLRTSAHREGGMWRIEGSKSSVVGAPEAERIIVSATGADGLVLAFLGRDTQGLGIRGFRTRRGDLAADLTFACAVPEADVIATGDTARLALRQAVQEAVIAGCWEAVGLARAILDLAVEHVKTRHQFGMPLAKLQVVRHKVAEMSVAFEEASAVLRAATLHVEARFDSRATSLAKVTVAEMARHVARVAVQLHGGMGVTQESATSALFNKLTAFDAMDGAPSEHRARYAAAVFPSGAFMQSAVLP